MSEFTVRYLNMTAARRRRARGANKNAHQGSDMSLVSYGIFVPFEHVSYQYSLLAKIDQLSKFSVQCLKLAALESYERLW